MAPAPSTINIVDAFQIQALVVENGNKQLRTEPVSVDFPLFQLQTKTSVQEFVQTLFNDVQPKFLSSLQDVTAAQTVAVHGLPDGQIPFSNVFQCTFGRALAAVAGRIRTTGMPEPVAAPGIALQHTTALVTVLNPGVVVPKARRGQGACVLETQVLLQLIVTTSNWHPSLSRTAQTREPEVLPSRNVKTTSYCAKARSVACDHFASVHYGMPSASIV
jgi:hypothetical protein